MGSGRRFQYPIIVVVPVVLLKPSGQALADGLLLGMHNLQVGELDNTTNPLHIHSCYLGPGWSMDSV